MKKILSAFIAFCLIQSIYCYAAEFAYQHEYDAENNHIQTITPNGEVLKYKYDCLNRLEKVECSNDEVVTYQYDINGQRKSVRNSFHETQYYYDALQRLH